MHALEHWIALSLVPDIGPVSFRTLLSVFGEPSRVFSASLKELSALEGIGRKRAENIRSFSAWKTVAQHIKRLDKLNAGVVTHTSPEYPDLLKQVDHAPPLLYTKGAFSSDDRFAIAVVGSRKATHYGKIAAERLSAELADAGFTVVSGMARGIDTISHRSALKSGGRTIAVLGSGIDRPYPPENGDLMELIAESGCVVSEFPLGTEPNREHFPARNRTISGLSLGVLVVEATRESGSLITVHHAVEQNREVFAVPGNITSSNSAGTNELIKSGAKLVTTVDDIVSELSALLKGFIKATAKTKITLTDEEQIVCDILTPDPKHVDTISRELSLPSPRVLALLLALELKGVVRQAEGMRYYLFA